MPVVSQSSLEQTKRPSRPWVLPVMFVLAFGWLGLQYVREVRHMTLGGPPY